MQSTAALFRPRTMPSPSEARVAMPTTPEKPTKQSRWTRFTDASTILAKCVAVAEPEVVQVTQIDPSGETLHLDKWHMMPTYRLKLTLWHRDRLCGEPGKLKRKEVQFKRDHADPETANAAALRLAISFRGEDEWVMLVSRQEGEDDRLNHYAVGVWDWEKLLGTRYPCMWKLKLNWEKNRLHSHKEGDLTAYVEVVRAWQTPMVPARQSLKVEGLQHADKHGYPPPGHPVLAPYRFGRYVMQVRNDRAWQRLITTTPLHPIRGNTAEVEMLREPRQIGEPNTHDHLAADAWQSQNIDNTIAGLESNIRQLRRLKRRPRNLQARFVPEDTEEERQSLIERPADFDWHLTKKWVIAKDIATLEKRVQRLNSLKPTGRTAAIMRSGCITLYTCTTSPLLSLFCALAAVAQSLSRCVFRLEYRKPNKTPVSPQGSQEKSLPKESCPDANTCMCTAHRWRRSNFPDHDPLPIVDKCDDYTDPNMYAKTPVWARDRLYKARHVQHFVPEKKKNPEPTTFCEYVRRELEINRPIPREAYVRFRVMTKQDCVNRWGRNWESGSQEVEKEFDKKRNVMKRVSKTEPATLPSSRDAYPWSELDGYPGCLREHEMPPLHDWRRRQFEVTTAVVMTMAMCSVVSDAERTTLRAAGLIVLMLLC
ncbi:uncharacterized protein M421DRAFT_333000 [Didymella exigua CBS 183.55]|uniref:Uncharacterized protein n=1 Tax=Didymella exigua CBS 183.55 TaxID=1150837 RepID=A0A6A5RBA6_9PLEO|nr:uncharacterized protein M421DRAFT_333000 [Didymella exigua CBS 183.55]KAF1923077.1 hypothetical protein M421DRAFT_333000 [Didymella exigua CBS 183.55]